MQRSGAVVCRSIEICPIADQLLYNSQKTLLSSNVQSSLPMFSEGVNVTQRLRGRSKEVIANTTIMGRLYCISKGLTLQQDGMQLQNSKYSLSMRSDCGNFIKHFLSSLNFNSAWTLIDTLDGVACPLLEDLGISCQTASEPAFGQPIWHYKYVRDYMRCHKSNVVRAII